MRGIAVILVMMAHYRYFYDTGGISAYDAFPRGVQLFYIVSGFILYWLYHDKLRKKEVPTFITKRFFRIAPMYYVALVIGIITLAKEINPLSIFLHVTLIGNGFHPSYINNILHVEWSIFVEFFFYLCFPALLFFYKKNRFITLGAVVAVSFIQSFLGIVNHSLVMKDYFYFLPTTQMCFFVLGMFLSDIFLSGNLVIKNKVFATVGFIAGLSVMFAICTVIHATVVQLYTSFISLGLMVLFYPSMLVPKWIRSALLWTGERSFSIYLIHFMPVLIVQEHLETKPLWLMFASLALVFIISHITYKFIELPGIRLGKALTNMRNENNEKAYASQ